MALKTNKSFSKRLKISKHGKVKSRRPGQNHFNAKESRSNQLHKKGVNTFRISHKMASRMLPGIKIKN